MSSDESHCTCLRPFIFCNILVMSFLLVLYTYYNPNVEVTSFHRYPPFMNVHLNHSGECSRSQEQDNSTAQSENVTLSTIILIWTWPFQRKFDTDCEGFGVKKCYLTDDRRLYNKADGVFFHHVDVNLHDLPKTPRPCFQKWIWTNMESPANSAKIDLLDNLFNVTCNYRLDANIPVPYGYLMRRNTKDLTFQLPKKDKLVCWIVSNWKTHLLRVEYYRKLKDHIEINAYGRAFGNPLSDEAGKNAISSSKFYLAFENSIHTDYITEKLFKPLLLGSVPIVLGPPRSDYEKQIPAGAFIHVNDFASPKELADRLHYLNTHTEEYMKYFEWRKEYEVKLSHFGKEHACRTCGYIQKHRGHREIHRLSGWFWGRK